MIHRLGFAGTPAFAERILHALIESPHSVNWVLSQPDRPFGRGRRTVPSPVKQRALEAGIPVSTPARLSEADAEPLRDLDYLVVAAYGLILPPVILDAPRHGCINVHASLLPRWRGAAPVERAIMNGDAETGVCIMQMDAGLDTGPVYLSRAVAIAETTTGGALSAELASLGAELLIEFLATPDLEPTPQNDTKASYAPKITAADTRIDWRRSAREIDRQIRALRDRSPAYSRLEGERVRVLEAAPEPRTASPGRVMVDGRRLWVGCGEGRLEIRRLQLARGKGRPLDTRDALNGHADLLRDGVSFETDAV